MLNSVVCQCCGHQEMRSITQFKEYEQMLCDSCGYVRFIHLSKQVSHLLYEDDSDYNDDLSVANNFEDFIHWNHNKALRYISAEFPAGSTSILDVGCFNGFFVKKLLSLGFNAQGIDFNNTALEFGRSRYGLENFISNKTLEDMLVQEKRFDVITLFEVIEHLENINDVLLKVSNLLTEEGIIIISTPNSNMCWRPDLDFPPHHLSRFSPGSLRRCVERFGFEPVQLDEQMSSYDLIRNYVGTFFREKNKNSLRGGAFKNKSSIRVLRISMNKLKRVGWILFFPLDLVLHFFGLRYICQLVIAKKI